jgi:hypothetical protein
MIRAARVALVLLGLAACAGGDEVQQTTGTGGTGGATSTSSSSAATGGAPSGDPLPQGAVSFFRTEACPSGWAPYDAAAGRFVVPTVGNEVGGIPHGQPLASGEDRTHLHDIAASFTLEATSFAGIAGEANHGVAAAGTATFSTVTEPASTGLPYVQLRACKKLDPAVPRATPLPAGMQVFIDAPGCPEGWKQVAASQGRFLVGLPAGAPADTTFGGAPLAGALPKHAHAGATQLVTTPHGIALASGCCANGYAKNGTYDATADAAATETALPYVALLSCEKT